MNELEKLLESAGRINIKSFLQREIDRLKREITTAENKQKAQEKLKTESAPTVSKRFVSELTNYAWDQSDKFVKLFVTLDGVEKIENPDSNVMVEFTENSMNLKIYNFTDRDYKFVVNNLLEKIVVEKSYRKVKSDMIAIYLKKASEGRFQIIFEFTIAKFYTYLRSEMVSLDFHRKTSERTEGKRIQR